MNEEEMFESFDSILEDKASVLTAIIVSQSLGISSQEAKNVLKQYSTNRPKLSAQHQITATKDSTPYTVRVWNENLEDTLKQFQQVTLVEVVGVKPMATSPDSVWQMESDTVLEELKKTDGLFQPSFAAILLHEGDARVRPMALYANPPAKETPSRTSTSASNTSSSQKSTNQAAPKGGRLTKLSGENQDPKKRKRLEEDDDSQAKKTRGGEDKTSGGGEKTASKAAETKFTKCQGGYLGMEDEEMSKPKDPPPALQPKSIPKSATAKPAPKKEAKQLGIASFFGAKK
eukprot:Platyproteum_vivax@DN4821_c0_g1_i1.p1